MPPVAARKSRGKKAAKDKDTTSRQISLLDAFGVRTSSKKTTPTTSAAQSENGSTTGDDVIDIPSSDAEPLTELPVDSSSPVTIEEGESQNDEVPIGRVEMKFGSANQAGRSRDAPIVVADSSPLASPVSLAKARSSHVPSPPKAPPKALFSIFAPRKRPETRESSPSKLYGKPSTIPPAPFPDGVSQHVRGPQCEDSVLLSHFPRRDPLCIQPSAEPNAEVGVSIYPRLTRRCEDERRNTPKTAFYRNEIDPADSTIRDRCTSSIPPHHQQYPAIRCLLDQPTPSPSIEPETSSGSNLLWNDRWCPKRADEVLGNEQSAVYLRDWLVALKLHIHGSGDAPDPSAATSDKKGRHKTSKAKSKAKGPRGTKRPRIVRNVERKRRRVASEEPEESWIADDSSEDDPLDLIFTSEDDLIGYSSSRLRRGRDAGSPNDSGLPSIDETSENASGCPSSDDVLPFSYRPPKFGDTIRNTVLLTGPSGCGKTAAVYACAKELGWEVFEVYPGIGDRSGAALQKLIGEVGKNHLVKQTQPKAKTEKDKPDTKPKRNFFAKRVVSDDESESSQAPVADLAAQPQEEMAMESAEISQSIVLVEEVDILYREDANFWPTMVKIIKECHRPVVMTCNDASLVPIDDLPLQTTLCFAPCPVPLAVSYLQLRSLTEGLEISAALTSQLYRGLGEHAARHERCFDDTLYPRSRWIPQSAPDLRRTINQLQFGTRHPCELGRPPSENATQDQSPQAFRRTALTIELCSFVDSGLRRPASGVMHDLLADSALPCADDVLGFQHLSGHFDDPSSSTPVTFSTYHRDEAILDDLLAWAARRRPTPNEILSESPDLPLLHTSYCDTLLPILDRLRVSREDLVRDPAAIFLDYEPWIRHMVRTDDAHIASTLASGNFKGTTRRTQNSQRSQWELQRWISLDEVQRGVLGRTALDGVDANVVTTPALAVELASSQQRYVTLYVTPCTWP